MSKSNPVDEPGAFPAREWLRQLVIGKAVRFETRKQGASAGDRVYGWLFLEGQTGPEPLHLAVECVRQGYGTPKSIKFGTSETLTGGGGDGTADVAGAATTPEEEATLQYEQSLLKAFREAQEDRRGIHCIDPVPVVRNVKNAGDDFATLALVTQCQKLASQGRISCVIEHVFDGSRFRCQVVDPDFPDYRYATFTLLLAGASCPRLGNPKADPPTKDEPFAEEARQFVTTRLLQRELKISLLGTDKAGSTAVGIIHHPAGNIAVELLKNGLAKMTDWTVRLMPVADVPALRFAENQAKRTLIKVWKSYQAPVLQTSAASFRGTVVEILSGDTLAILPEGKDYLTEESLTKVSLASIRAPRLGRADGTRDDEPFAAECKERLRVLTIGKLVNVAIHYERDIPLQPGVNETRAFGTISVGKYEDISEVLISEGLAVTQFHRDEDPTSPRYDELRAAEAVAKAAKKGQHKEGDHVQNRAVIDLTDPRKAKGYSGALMRAGNLKAVVDFVFNGALFKLLVPSENCYIRFAPNYIRCPQPSPSPGSKQQNKPAEPFGDESKRHARLLLLQHNVEINCTGVTNSGIITGTLNIRVGGSQVNYATEILGVGLATLDQRKVEYGEVPKDLLQVEATARENKLGLWKLEQKKDLVAPTSGKVEKSKDRIVTVRLSEIRSGSHFFFHEVNDDAAKVVEESMKQFTQNNGIKGAPCDSKVNKVVAALFDDGSGKSWYRAKILERKGPSQVSVLFVDHGNVATVPISTHLRPLDSSLDTTRIPPVAKEASLALTVTRPLDKDEGVDAARFFQTMCWGRDLNARILAPDENNRLALILYDGNSNEESVNAKLVSEGLARASRSADFLCDRMVDPSTAKKLHSDLKAAEDAAHRMRLGMWRYGDIGDDDDDALA